MSEVFDRMLRASSNAVLAPIDADDVRGLFDFYESSPGEHPRGRRAAHPFYG